jgi:hypothetical protein
MEGSFKIKYKTRFKLQKAIQQTITQISFNESGEGTGTMHDSIRISAATGDLNQLYVTINAIFYYMFLDKGAKLTNGGEIRPYFITQKAIDSPLGQQFISDAIGEYLVWMQANYPILDVATINIPPDNVKLNITYNLFGSDGIKNWDGKYEYDKNWWNW